MVGREGQTCGRRITVGWSQEAVPDIVIRVTDHAFVAERRVPLRNDRALLAAIRKAPNGRVLGGGWEVQQ